MIQVDVNKCLGCFACSNICPNQFITREEEEGKRRTIRWSKCKEECDICVEFCPAKALTLVPYSDSTPEVMRGLLRSGSLRGLQKRLCYRAIAEEDQRDRSL